MSISLTEKFLKGLEEYNLTYEQIIRQGWRYCGGDTDRHRNYFKTACPKDPIPEHIENY
jgi:hypothetical protein